MYKESKFNPAIKKEVPNHKDLQDKFKAELDAKK